MAYYNGNYRAGQRQSNTGCPNNARSSHNNRSRSSVSVSVPASAQASEPCCRTREAAPPSKDCPCREQQNRTENSRMGEGRSDGMRQQSSCMLSPDCPLAIAYIPWQAFEQLYDECKAFTLGTAFPSLFKPFMAGGKCR